MVFRSVGLSQCDEGFIWIDDPPLNEYNWDGYNCFYELDLNVLSEFIQLNSSLSGQHLDIGWQYWVNGRLEGLTLYALQLTSIPNNIGSLNNLTYLNLHFNQITNIPETIGELTQLTEIYLENNLFGILPESIGNLTNLITLNINENQLISIPENIGNLTGLEELLLYNNSLTSLPESICNIFSNLSQYDFSDNYICPPYPYCIENVGYQDTSNCEPECNLTTDDILGPYYFENAPIRNIIAHQDEPGQRLFISGRIMQDNCEYPISGSMIEVWHPNDAGCYSIVEDCNTGNPENDYFNLRGKFFSDVNGYYYFESILPGHYGTRPRHVHIKITTPNGEVLISQLYFENDPFCETDPYCQSAEDRIISLQEIDLALYGEMEFIMNSNESGIIIGDLNYDNSVDILDVIILVNHILSPAAVELDGADINGDGEVNILDVVALVNIILDN